MEAENMLEKHEELLNGEDGLSPRVKALEDWKEAATVELNHLKNETKEIKLAQQDLKNTVNRVENTIIAALNSQTSTLDKVLDFSMKIKEQTEETDRALISAKSNEKIAGFTTFEKIIVGVAALLFGTGGIAGLVTAWETFSK